MFTICHCDNYLRNPGIPCEIVWRVYTHNEWQFLMNEPIEKYDHLLPFPEWVVWRCNQCFRLLISGCPVKEFKFWKPVPQETANSLISENCPCLCRKIPNRDSVPEKYKLLVYTDEEWEKINSLEPDMFNPTVHRSAVAASHYDVWGCPDCKRIYAFYRDDLTPFVIYDFED
jgi:hypothetical protein